MKTCKSIMNAVDELLLSIDRKNDYDRYIGALRAAKAAHGCAVRVRDGVVYEVHQVYGDGVKHPRYGEVDAALVDIRNDCHILGKECTWLVHEYFGAKRLARAVHGCYVEVRSDGVYEWREVYRRAAVKPNGEVKIDE